MPIRDRSRHTRRFPQNDVEPYSAALAHYLAARHKGVCLSSDSRADTSAMPAALPPAKPSDMTAGIDAVYSGT